MLINRVQEPLINIHACIVNMRSQNFVGIPINILFEDQNLHTTHRYSLGHRNKCMFPNNLTLNSVASEQSLTDRKTTTLGTANGQQIICFKTCCKKNVLPLDVFYKKKKYV